MENIISNFGTYVNMFVAVGTFALTQAVKSSLPETAQKHIPLIAVGLGVVANTALTVASGATPSGIIEGVIAGAISGAAAVGVYEATKTKKDSE